MAVNTAVNQGTLNRLRGAITVTDHPELNITAEYLGVGAISIAPEGPVTDFINTLTGRITSPVPYIPVTITVHLNRTQSLAAAWLTQAQTNTLIGNITITPDVTTFPNMTVRNCGIASLPTQTYAGTDPDFPITISGYIIVNTELWEAA